MAQKWSEMDSFIKRLNRVKSLKTEIDEVVAKTANLDLHPRLSFLIPWLNYSYSIFIKQVQNREDEIESIFSEAENFKSRANRITVSTEIA